MSDIQRADGKPVGHLGLGGSTETKPQWVDRAYRQGVDYFFFYNTRFSGMVRGVSALCRRHRSNIVIASGSESRAPDDLVEALSDTKQQLETDYLDVFFLEYVAPSEAWEDIEKALELLAGWKSDEHIRYVGVSVHDRDLAIRLAGRDEVDCLMHRYNMAHRKSEEAVLPEAIAAGVPVVAFTCTRWGSLLKGHAEWEGPIPDASDCYRFALSHPAVRLALTAPGSIGELDANLTAMTDAPVSDSDLAVWRDYGDLVYGEGSDAFETRWP